MKKKFLAGILVFIMIFGMATTSFAVDPKVQAVYDACEAVKTAFEGTSVADAKAAMQEFEAISESMYDFTEQQQAELQTLLGTDWEEALLEYIMYYICCGVVVETDAVYEKYVANKNVKTAYDFVEMYDSIFNEDEFEIPQLKIAIKRFFPDIDLAYADAKTNMPSAKTLDIMALYDELDALQYSWDYDEFKEALNGDMEEKLAELDELDQATLDEISAMFEKPAEKVIEEMQGMYDTAKLIEEIGDVYHAFNEKNSVKNANAYIDVYEAMFGEYSVLTNKEKRAIKNFFFDLKDVYKTAKKVVQKAEAAEEEVVETDETDEIKSPKTGDYGTSAVWMIMILAAGCASMLYLSERKNKKANS